MRFDCPLAFSSSHRFLWSPSVVCWPKTLIRQLSQLSGVTTTFGLSVKSQKTLTFLGLPAAIHGIIQPTTYHPRRYTMLLSPLSLICRGLTALASNVKQRLRRWTKPDNQSLALNAVLDLTRPKSELVLENALLRQQLIVLQRHAKRPTLSWRDRALFVYIASKLPTWKTALMIVQPDTLLRWHRDLFRLV